MHVYRIFFFLLSIKTMKTSLKKNKKIYCERKYYIRSITYKTINYAENHQTYPLRYTRTI